MRAFAPARDVQGAVRVLEQMRAEGVAPTPSTFAALAEVCGQQAGDLRAAAEMLLSMRRFADAEALQDAYAVMIRRFGSGARARKALDVAERLSEAGVGLDQGLLAAVLRLAAAVGDAQLARECVSRLPHPQLEPYRRWAGGPARGDPETDTAGRPESRPGASPQAGAGGGAAAGACTCGRGRGPAGLETLAATGGGGGGGAAAAGAPLLVDESLDAARPGLWKTLLRGLGRAGLADDVECVWRCAGAAGPGWRPQDRAQLLEALVDASLACRRPQLAVAAYHALKPPTPAPAHPSPSSAHPAGGGGGGGAAARAGRGSLPLAASAYVKLLQCMAAAQAPPGPGAR